MGLRIGTNVSAIAANRYMNQSQREIEQSISELASGNRLSGHPGNAADLAISEHLRGQVKGMQAAQANAQNAASFVQVAEGGLNEQNNILIRMRELAIQSASDTFSDVERGFIQQEFGELQAEFDRIAQSTQFGSQKLLAGDVKDYEFQVGAYKGEDNVIKFRLDTDTTASGVGIDGLSVSDKGDARDSLESIDDALTKVAQARSTFGATQSRLQIASDNLDTQVANITEARSNMADTDVADAVARLTQAQIRQSFQTSVLAQANQSANQVLKLLA